STRSSTMNIQNTISRTVKKADPGELEKQAQELAQEALSQFTQVYGDVTKFGAGVYGDVTKHGEHLVNQAKQVSVDDLRELSFDDLKKVAGTLGVTVRELAGDVVSDARGLWTGQPKAAETPVDDSASATTSSPSEASTAKTTTAKSSTAKSGTAQSSTAKSGTTKSGSAKTS